MNTLFFKTAAANRSGAMEAETISKNGRCSKSQMSRVKRFIFVFVGLFFTYYTYQEKKENQRKKRDLMNRIQKIVNQNNVLAQKGAAVANSSGAMEVDTIQNRQNPNSHISRENNQYNSKMKKILLTVVVLLFVCSTSSFAQIGWIKNNPAPICCTIDFVQADCANSDATFVTDATNVISNWRVEMIENDERPEVEAPTAPKPPMPPAAWFCETVFCLISEWK